MKRLRVIIMGAAGRDYHNFLVFFKDNPLYKVVAFTASQIPGIANKIFPSKLAGKSYPKGIKIYPERKLSQLIKKHRIDLVCLSYSDLSHEEVMHKASIALANRANFMLLGPEETSLKSKKAVVAVTAVRTGCGKSQTARKITLYYKKAGRKVVVVRHPMPYGDLTKQEAQRFATYDDLIKHNCTIEEREEYEPHLRNGIVVYAGINYKKILGEAEKEADIIIWDGGNNDTPFIKPNLLITVVDPHRAGHELSYYPGEINFRMADVIIINKVHTAKKENIQIIKENIKKANPKAVVIEAASPIKVTNPDLIKNKDVLVIEDGPTLTHGGMSYGSGTIAAKEHKCRSIVDGEKYAVGSIKHAYKEYKHLKKIVPALGYGKRQIKELQKTINKAKCDLVIDGSPIDIKKLIKINKPLVNASYELKMLQEDKLLRILKKIK